MFTGIIEATGRVAAVDHLGGGRRLVVEAPFASELRVDQSVAVNGACLTVVACDERTFAVDVIEETLRKTSHGRLAAGDPVNLERAMPAGGRLDGHVVQGHVDATGEVVGIEREGTDWLFHLRCDPRFAPYLVPVGSVALDGISLTVARLERDAFTVAIIPYTYEHTTMHAWEVGRRVNLEFDVIGKYIVRWMELRGGASGG